MTVACKAAGLSFFALGLIARRATGQATTYSTCETLKTAVEDASGTASFTLGADFECTDSITIASGGEITIEGAANTITIATTFMTSSTATSSGLFIVAAGGELVLNDVTITATDDESEGIRGVYNEGTLSVNNCIFSKLNTNVGTSDAFVARGAAIYTASSGKAVKVTDSTFTSNVVTTRGGAICADGTDLLTVSGSVFTSNEAGLDDEEAGAGGDIYATRGVTLTVISSNFTKSTAYYGGAAIECCGATISDSQFTATESAMDTEHYGALLVGRPGEDPCPMELKISDSTFTRCTVDVGEGAGGAMAIFDTAATVTDCTFESSQGTAVVFQSSDPTTPYQLMISSSYFYGNSRPAKEFSLSENTQGTALAIQNTGLGDGEEASEMGEFNNVFCFENEPYECEFVYHDAIMVHEGEFKCQICNQDGERQDPGTDDFLSGTDRDVNSGSDSSDGIVIGLSLALGLTLVVIGALAVWKFRVRKNARRLMEDMGEGDL